jgi:hypothetical protein
MTVLEYLGGLPSQQGLTPVEVRVDRQAVRLKHGGFLHRWSCQLPLSTIASAELTLVQDIRDSGILPADIEVLLAQPREYLLAIAVTVDDQPASIILRGPWTSLSRLRQDILQARMRAKRQWQP